MSAIKGKPLADAKVVLEPEPYLGNDIQAGEGVTTISAPRTWACRPKKRLRPSSRMKLIQYGTFKVRITHPTIKIPAKYNTETTLGYETIPGDPSVSFALK